MPESVPFAIAIDGPASSGKGTVARAVARALDYAYIDTGSIYRTVAWEARERGIDWGAGEALGAMSAELQLRIAWEGELLVVWSDQRRLGMELREEEIGRGASAVAVHPEVRGALLELQRELARSASVVMDGRDIGTVVLPDAQLKIFLDASLEARTERRYQELLSRGVPTDRDQLARELEARDRQDRERAEAPLRQASDAVLLDTTQLSPEGATEVILQLAAERGASRG